MERNRCNGAGLNLCQVIARLKYCTLHRSVRYSVFQATARLLSLRAVLSSPRTVEKFDSANVFPRSRVVVMSSFASVYLFCCAVQSSFCSLLLVSEESSRGFLRPRKVVPCFHHSIALARHFSCPSL